MGGGASSLHRAGGENEEVIGTLCYDNIELDSWPGKLHSTTGLPPAFQLLLGHESLDFIDDHGKPLYQFPYQVIISWGYSPSSFRFSIPARASDENSQRSSSESISICVRTPYGVAADIDRNIMTTVLKLMDDMKKCTTATADEFSILKRNIFVQPPQIEPPAAVAAAAEGGSPPEDGEAQTGAQKSSSKQEPPLCVDELQDEWMTTIRQFTATRALLAKQAMELVQLIGPIAPFERMDLAEMLYDRILNKDSFQLIINAFEDKAERENLTHRLKLKGFSTDATLINI